MDRVGYQLVWDVVRQELPEIKRNTQSIVDNLQRALQLVSELDPRQIVLLFRQIPPSH